MDEFEHMKIQLEEIKKATCDFHESLIIGSGGFGKVYQGEGSYNDGPICKVAVKRLDPRSCQGDPEFWKEVMLLSRYTHTNLISLIGFCNEDGEKILVYEYASNGSVDRHLSSGSLTWAQRIKICLDAAKGLTYLHDHNGTQQRVLHRDIKSSNILLDENWNAKLADMGLSKLGPANQLYTGMITHVVGTIGYIDPQYITTCNLTKESYLYSFGVVLLEVLCGRLCFEVDSNRELQILVPTWKESYKHGKLNEIIFKDATTPIDMISLEMFADIAFHCLQETREERPSISFVVLKIETALKFQERYEMKLLEKRDNRITKVMETWSETDLSYYIKEIFFEPENLYEMKLCEMKLLEKPDNSRTKVVDAVMETLSNYIKWILFELIYAGAATIVLIVIAFITKYTLVGDEADLTTVICYLYLFFLCFTFLVRKLFGADDRQNNRRTLSPNLTLMFLFLMSSLGGFNPYSSPVYYTKPTPGFNPYSYPGYYGQPSPGFNPYSYPGYYGQPTPGFNPYSYPGNYGKPTPRFNPYSYPGFYEQPLFNPYNRW